MSDFQYIDKQQLLENYPFSKGQIDYFLSKRHVNGLNKAVCKIGKRLYFRKDLLDSWLNSHLEKGGCQ
jgi:hypothetical protein